MPGTGLRHATVSATVPLTCDSGKAGTLRYNSTNTALELCTGTGRQVMGVGIPAGTISAFASTTCSTGWSEYTPARGRFLRRIDNGAGNDPDATRVAGSVQGDALSDASTGLTWDNANSRLTTVNISATALTVNGVPITGDRIVSGSTSVVAKGSGTVEVSGTLTLKDNPDAGCVSSTLGAFTQINHRLYFCRP